MCVSGMPAPCATDTPHTHNSQTVKLQYAEEVRSFFEYVKRWREFKSTLEVSQFAVPGAPSVLLPPSTLQFN